MTGHQKRISTGWCHICKDCVQEPHKHYLKKHPEQTKYKLYSPIYDKLCKYKNCWNLWVGDGYCLNHITRMVIA